MDGIVILGFAVLITLLIICIIHADTIGKVKALHIFSVIIAALVMIIAFFRYSELILFRIDVTPGLILAIVAAVFIFLFYMQGWRGWFKKPPPNNDMHAKTD